MTTRFMSRLGTILLCGTALGAIAAPPMPLMLTQPAAHAAWAGRALMLGVARAGSGLVAVGEHGFILLSRDNGRTWSQARAVPTSVTLTRVRFATPVEGWAVGHMGVVLHTADGGVTWTRVTDGAAAAHLALERADAIAAAAPGDEAATALRTGAEQLVQDGPDKPLLALLAGVPGQAVALGAFGTGVRVEGGPGQVASMIDRLGGAAGLHVYGIDERGGVVYAAGEQGLVLRARRGEPFAPLSSPYKGTYFGVLALSADEVMVYGLRGNLYRSADGGRAWERIDSGTQQSITSAIVLADGGVLLGTQGGQLLVSRDRGRSFGGFAQTPQPVADLAQAADGGIVVAGPRGVLRVGAAMKTGAMMNQHIDPSRHLAPDVDPAAQQGSLLEHLLFGHRKLIVALCALLTLVFGWTAARLEFNTSFDSMIPTHHPYIVNYLKHKDDLKGLGNTLRIVVETEGDTIFDPAYMETLKSINDRVFLLPGVDRSFMKSLWTPSTAWIAVTEEGLEGGPVMPERFDGSARSLQQLRTNIERSGEIGQLVAPDFKSTIISVPLLDNDPRTGRALDYGELSRALEKVRTDYAGQHVRVRIVGFAKIVGDLIGSVNAILGFFCISVLIVTATVYAYTRCVRSTGLVVLCSLVAVVWQLGLLPLLGFRLDPYSILVPFLVFAIGMSHGAQKMNGVMQDIGRGLHRLMAARMTFRRLFIAGLTALVCDAVGFAVLLVIDIPAIRQLALVASIGVAVLIFTNLILLPILLSYTGVSPRAAARSLRYETESLAGKRKPALWRWLDLFTVRRYAALALLAGVAMGAGAYVVSLKLQVGDLDPGAPELRKDSRYNRDSAYLTSHYASSSDVLVVMAKTPVAQCGSYAALAVADALEMELRNLPGVEATLSLAGFSRKMSAALNEGSLAWYEIVPNQDTLNAVIVKAPRELFNQACDLLPIFVYLQDHKAATLSGAVATIERFAAAHNGPQITFLLAAGNAGIEAATNIVVQDANRAMLFWVYGAVILLSFVTFRSWRAVVVAVLPLVLTSVMAEALMVQLGIGVKVATLPVTALGVGIGIDYALYILSITLAALRRGASLSDAYYEALQFTGKVVMLTGLTLAFGVATWAWSPIKFQADMGILLAFMFIWNMLGALILLPALAHFLLPRRRPA